MHDAEIVDAAAKLEEQRRRNRLAPRRRRERQRNRAASVNTDPLSIISPDGQNQEPSEKTWNFVADGDFFDPFLEEQDCIGDQCHQHYTTVINTAELATEQATTAEPISPAAKPNANGKGLSEPQLTSGTHLGANPPGSHHHQFYTC